MDDEIDDGPPEIYNTFAIPNDVDLIRVREVYKTSKETRALLSEHGRETFPDMFIDDVKLGTLSDLCVRALAKQSSLYIAPLVQQDPLKLRIHYDAIDVDTPLKDCYFIDDLLFWRRVVLAKCKDATLLMKKKHEYDWKSKGISMKYIELVEAASAEYWPEKEMEILAKLVKDYVKEMHIKKLQSLKIHSFEHYFHSDSDTDFSESVVSLEISSDEPSTANEEIEEEEEEPVERDSKNVKFDKPKKLPEPPVHVETVEEEDEEGEYDENEKSLTLLEWERKENERRHQRSERNAIRQALRADQDKLVEAREERHQKRALRLNEAESPPEVKKKKKKPKKFKGVFDIEVEPEPDDSDEQIPDGRNKEKQMDRFKRYKYPPEHCHHIDLSFIRYFDNLTSFTLEFLGPAMSLDYHPRHLNFSYSDMKHLAKGLKSLALLKVFRLRNSRMDTRKLQILMRGLKDLEALEVVDFGYDNLEDDCGTALSSLFDFAPNLHSIELEHNKLGLRTMEALSFALRCEDCAPIRYLGLAHNPLDDEQLGILCKALIGTEKVEDLNLTGIECSSMGLVQWVGDGLLRQHKPLKSLNVSVVPLGNEAGRELVRALNTNMRISKFDCRGCGLDEEAEYEANLIVRRNSFMLSNPCVGDDMETEEEITKCVTDMKHPILAKVLNEIATREECIQNRPLLKTPSVESVELEEEQTIDEKYAHLFGLTRPTTATVVSQQRPPTTTSDYSDRESMSSEESLEPFVYDPNSFNEAEFLEYVFEPGPSNRYLYFTQNREQW